MKDAIANKQSRDRKWPILSTLNLWYNKSYNYLFGQDGILRGIYYDSRWNQPQPERPKCCHCRHCLPKKQTRQNRVRLPHSGYPNSNHERPLTTPSLNRQFYAYELGYLTADHGNNGGTTVDGSGSAGNSNGDGCRCFGDSSVDPGASAGSIPTPGEGGPQVIVSAGNSYGQDACSACGTCLENSAQLGGEVVCGVCKACGEVLNVCCNEKCFETGCEIYFKVFCCCWMCPSDGSGGGSGCSDPGCNCS